MAFLLAVAFWCSEVQAQILIHFDLPTQPLARSLKAIGAATNTDIGFSANEVAGLIAPPIKADLTVDGALTRVLAGTGLRPKYLNDHTIVIAYIAPYSLGRAEKAPSLMKVSGPTAVDQITTPQDLTQPDSTDESKS